MAEQKKGEFVVEQMRQLAKAYLDCQEQPGRIVVLEQYSHEDHVAGWLELVGTPLGIYSDGSPLVIRSFHCQCSFQPLDSRDVGVCWSYEKMLEGRYKMLTASFKERFESGRRAFLPHQIEVVIEELLRMIADGEFVEPDGRRTVRGEWLRPETLAKIIELPERAASGHLGRYAVDRGLRVENNVLLVG